MPVYNGENYLRKTIPQIKNQTYRNFELILVNDGSTDETEDILSEAAIDDPRIRMISQENLGMSAARNKGISFAKGEYITFIDADDFVGIDYLHVLVSPLLGETDTEISVLKFKKSFDYDEKKFTKEDYTLKVGNVTGLKKCLLQEEGYDVAVWGKMYKKKLFENIKFVDGLAYEDLEIIPRIFAEVGANKKIVFLNSIQYLYIKTNNSVMTSSFNSKDKDILKIIKYGEKFVSDHIPDVQKEYLAKAIAGIFGVYRKALWTDASLKDRRIIFYELRAQTKKVNFRNLCSKKEFVICFIVSLGQTVSTPFIKLITRYLKQL
jgi:glycosyltransferase involved in cell wall biosynthesis